MHFSTSQFHGLTLRARKLVTAALWTTFSAVYPPYPEAADVHQVIAPWSLPLTGLRQIHPSIYSPRSNFITLLTVANQGMTHSSWLSLSELANLRVLLVDAGESSLRFTERVARNWISARGMRNLYALVLCAYDEREAVSVRMMGCLSMLPHLHVVGLRGVYLAWEAEGWVKQA